MSETPESAEAGQATVQPSMQWTSGQAAAIEDRGRDLVVSASAGSGKTAVLTERVLKLVTDPNPSTGEPAARIEELLIITFTEKAARQMRERIEKRIRKALDAEPESHRLHGAYDGLSAAWIMTIDAFCRRIVTQNFHEAGVSPNPRIPDAAELAELERLALDELMEAWAKDPDRREALAELIASCGKKADGLAADVRKLIGFLQSLDQPEAWLSRVQGALEQTARATRFEDLPEAHDVRETFNTGTRELVQALRGLIHLAAARGGDGDKLAEWQRLADELEALTHSQIAFRPDPLRSWLESDVDGILGKLELKKNCGDTLYKDASFKKNFLERFSKHYKLWREQWFALGEAGLLHGARLAAAQSRTMLDLAEAAIERIEQAKQRRGLLTFNDFERLTLKILSDPARPDAPSEVAHRLRGQFKFVLVDEYQDTSPLQDAIVRRIARSDDPAQDANLFLVGDIKQSIYRFRHAEPALFLGKMHAAAQATPRLRRINLHENFRSRPAVLEFINQCFEGIMDRAVGELDYAGEERLKPGRLEPGGADPVAVEVQWLPRDSDDGAADSTTEGGEPGENGEDNNNNGEACELTELLAGVEAQAQWVARRIRELTDPAAGIMIPEEAPPTEPNPPLRRALPGDCAILLRGIRGELEIWTQALEREGLKVRAPGVNPLFATSEMLDLLSALRIADHPFQDIPLATLMRSPLGGFSDNELLAIRMQRRSGPFYSAVWEVAGRPLPEADTPAEAPPHPQAMTEALRGKVEAFVQRVERWRRAARRGPAYDVLSLILEDTGYEAFLMGHLDGLSRIEHLDFLRGLILKLGKSNEGANPLAVFLEMIGRAESEEGEVGELPESVAGHMDAVNLLTIHRSKGLEFPIVFLPRLERAFRKRQAAETHFDRGLGMTRGGVDVPRRRRFPTLAHRAMIDRLQRKDRSEEIRLLYVAMTRARERLVLVAQPGKLDTLDERWGTVKALGGEAAGTLDRLHARTPADLIGPIVHWLTAGGGRPWLEVREGAPLGTRRGGDAWTLVREAYAQWKTDKETGRKGDGEMSPSPQVPLAFLPPVDPGAPLTVLPTKTSVSALKREREALLAGGEELAREEGRFLEEEMIRPLFTRQGRLTDRKPAWLDDGKKERQRLSADRRGTLTHAVLANVELTGRLDADGLREQAARLIEAGLVGSAFEERELILSSLDFDAMAWFFTTEAGQKMTKAPSLVDRELAFTARRDLADFAPEAARFFPQESMLVQGVIDAVIDEGPSTIVIDYKTDRVRDHQHLAELVERYRFQITQYTQALEAIWRLSKGNATGALVFLDARQVIQLS